MVNAMLYAHALTLNGAFPSVSARLESMMPFRVAELSRPNRARGLGRASRPPEHLHTVARLRRPVPIRHMRYYVNVRSVSVPLW